MAPLQCFILLCFFPVFLPFISYYFLLLVNQILDTLGINKESFNEEVRTYTCMCACALTYSVFNLIVKGKVDEEAVAVMVGMRGLWGKSNSSRRGEERR